MFNSGTPDDEDNDGIEDVEVEEGDTATKRGKKRAPGALLFFC